MKSFIAMAAIAFCERRFDSRRGRLAADRPHSANHDTLLSGWDKTWMRNAWYIYRKAYRSHLDFRARQKVHALDTRFMVVGEPGCCSSAILVAVDVDSNTSGGSRPEILNPGHRVSRSSGVDWTFNSASLRSRIRDILQAVSNISFDTKSRRTWQSELVVYRHAVSPAPGCSLVCLASDHAPGARLAAYPLHRATEPHSRSGASSGIDILLTQTYELAYVPKYVLRSCGSTKYLCEYCCIIV